MRQPELTPEAAAPVEHVDRFAEHRLAHPDSKFIEFHDLRTANTFVMNIPPASPWHALLPDTQVSEIKSTA